MSSAAEMREGVDSVLHDPPASPPSRAKPGNDDAMLSQTRCKMLFRGR
jgi:hypothetical protein